MQVASIDTKSDMSDACALHHDSRTKCVPFCFGYLNVGAQPSRHCSAISQVKRNSVDCLGILIRDNHLVNIALSNFAQMPLGDSGWTLSLFSSRPWASQHVCVYPFTHATSAHPSHMFAHDRLVNAGWLMRLSLSVSEALAT